MSDLKPCPFCGKDAQMAGADRGPVFAVWCGGCGACGGTSCSKERAIDAWNYRPLEDELAAALEGLVRLKDLKGVAQAVVSMEAHDAAWAAARAAVRRLGVEA